MRKFSVIELILFNKQLAETKYKLWRYEFLKFVVTLYAILFISVYCRVNFLCHKVNFSVGGGK